MPVPRPTAVAEVGEAGWRASQVRAPHPTPWRIQSKTWRDELRSRSADPASATPAAPRRLPRFQQPRRLPPHEPRTTPRSTNQPTSRLRITPTPLYPHPLPRIRTRAFLTLTLTCRPQGSASTQRLHALVTKVDAERAAWASERALLRAELESWRARDAGMARAMGDLAEGSTEGSGALAEVEARVAVPLERIGAAFERAKLSPTFIQVSQGAAGPEFAGEEEGGCFRTAAPVYGPRTSSSVASLRRRCVVVAPLRCLRSHATDSHYHPLPLTAQSSWRRTTRILRTSVPP